MSFKDLLFPKFCLGCGFLGAYICLKCQNNLYYIEKEVCLYCGRPSLHGLTHPGCQRINGIDGFLSILLYNNLLKKIIKNIKYRLATDIWLELCQVIKPEALNRLKFYKIFSISPSSLYVNPIPLHANRLRERGFNQAKLISEYFMKSLGLQLSDVIKRDKETLSQAQIEKNLGRYQNLKGAFSVIDKNKVMGRSYILVDDVVTSGSTIKEAARTLKLNGAAKVFALSLAKG